MAKSLSKPRKPRAPRVPDKRYKLDIVEDITCMNLTQVVEMVRNQIKVVTELETCVVVTDTSLENLMEIIVILSSMRDWRNNGFSQYSVQLDVEHTDSAYAELMEDYERKLARYNERAATYADKLAAYEAQEEARKERIKVRTAELARKKLATLKKKLAALQQEVQRYESCDD